MWNKIPLIKTSFSALFSTLKFNIRAIGFPLGTWVVGETRTSWVGLPVHKAACVWLLSF